MAQFDVHAMPGNSLRAVSLLIELQSDLVLNLDAAVVAPLIPLQLAGLAAKGLNPVLSMGDEQFVLRIEELVAVPRAVLGKTIGSLKSEREALTAAIDLLFFGI